MAAGSRKAPQRRRVGLGPPFFPVAKDKPVGQGPPYARRRDDAMNIPTSDSTRPIQSIAAVGRPN